MAGRHTERDRQAAATKAGQDIGAPEPPANPQRRADAAASLRLWYETYFPARFYLRWSPDQLQAIARIEEAICHGGLFALAMPRGGGKALALDTPLPTPTGWTTIGEVQPGDCLYDETGKACHVTFATEVQHSRECYQVTFDDGESVVCCADHLWAVNDRFSRKNPLTLTTAQMARRVVLSTKRGWTEVRYTIPIASPLVGKSADWMVHPYMLGVWLGDGHTATNRVTIGDQDAIEMRKLIERHERVSTRHHDQRTACASYTVGKGRWFQSEGRLAAERHVLTLAGRGLTQPSIAAETGLPLKTVQNIRWRAGRSLALQDVSLKTRLEWLGVLDNKHIPPAYLRASEEDRLALLRGLMDTDGSMERDKGQAEYVTKLPQLRDDVMDLLAGLGFKRRYRTKIINGRPYYRITFTPSDGRRVFDLPRKAARQKTASSRISATRRIVSIDPVASVPVRCIQVDSPNSLYLCGKGMVPTHNTTLLEGALLWAGMTARHHFAMLLAVNATRATDLLESVKTELLTNELLHEDWPEITHPIRALQGRANRAKGQHICETSTHIAWRKNEVVFPHVIEYSDGTPCAQASGVILRVAGLTGGGVRGQKFTRPHDGRNVRPSLVLLDDPQDDECASSAYQVEKRHKLIHGAVLGMAGPGKKLTAVMPCTIIRPGDLSYQLLDRDRSPLWTGQRHQLLARFPERMDLWDEYGIRRSDEYRNGGDGHLATAWYGQQKEVMDRGALASWPERHSTDELSALQHAMNLYYLDKAAFMAEYQNDPIPEVAGDGEQLQAEVLAGRSNGLPRAVAPIKTAKITAYIDVQGKSLWYVVCAWAPDFTGAVLDYGTFPDQQRTYYTLADQQRTLGRAFPGIGLEAQINSGLERLTEQLLCREWKREDGTFLRIERLLVDANWGASTDTVYTFCRRTPHAAIVMPAHGRAVTAASKPWSEYQKKPGEQIGFHWLLPASSGKHAVRHLLIDVNFWKSFLTERLRGDRATPGALTFWHADHRLFADHLVSEFRIRTEGRGRTVDEWKLKPERPDNHFLDCLVGCAAAASFLGVTHSMAAPLESKPRRKVSWAEMQRRARAEREGR